MAKRPLFRRGVAAIAAACLLLLQILAIPPGRAAAEGLAETSAAAFCATNAAGGLPDFAENGHGHCAICAGAAALEPPPVAARRMIAAPARTLGSPPPQAAPRPCPPGWTSGWSSQAPPRRA